MVIIVFCAHDPVILYNAISIILLFIVLYLAFYMMLIYLITLFIELIDLKNKYLPH